MTTAGDDWEYLVEGYVGLPDNEIETASGESAGELENLRVIIKDGQVYKNTL
jgi:hypothetical protein